MEGTIDMTENEMSATERQAAQLKGTLDHYATGVRQQQAADASRFNAPSAATDRQVRAAGLAQPTSAPSEATAVRDAEARLDRKLKALGIDPDDLDDE